MKLTNLPVLLMCLTIASLSLFFSRQANAARIVLVSGGKAAATVVIPAAANDREKLAAADLRHYVSRLCGVDLPLKTDGKQVAGVGLYIGRCVPTTDTDLPAKTLNPESYAIRVRDGSIYFNGRYPTPTYFAVASFIEDCLGVRWFAPGELWEYVPAGKPGELAVEVKSVVSVPDTSPRIWSGHAWTQQWKTWDLRNKAVVSEVVPWRHFQNNIYHVFPPSKYARTHPEYYPLINGKRWIPSSDNDPHWWPCVSNPDVQRLTVAYAEHWFDTHPLESTFSLGMDDISHFCGCPQCRAMDPHPDSYEQREFSDRYYKFVNIIARQIAEKYPGRYIGTLIYSVARNVPETVNKLADNVFGYITETSALWWQPGREAADHELTRQWARRCKHLSRYDYYGMGCITPRFYPHAMAEQIKFDKSLGMEGMYTEVYTFLPDTAPMIYAFAKLQWNSKLNVDDLLGEFYRDMFGAAAGTMKQYYDLLERSWDTPRPGRTGWVHRNLVRQALAMSPEEVDQGFHLLHQAMTEAKSDRVRQRIEIVRAGLRYGSYPIRAYSLSRKLMDLSVDNQQVADQALANATSLARLSRERQGYWAAAMRRHDLLGDTLRGLTSIGYTVAGQAPEVEGGGTAAIFKALTWYSEHQPNDLAAVTANLSAELPAGQARQLVRNWSALASGKDKNLLENGDFESTGQNHQQAEKDWQTAGAPPGWQTWASGGVGTLKVAPALGRHGAAASIAGAGSACFLQGVPVKEGEHYLCVAWARCWPRGSQANPKLGIRYNAKGGGWYAHRELEPIAALPPGSVGWQPLVLVVTIPRGAARLIVMPSAAGQERGAAALFDDVALFRLD